MTSNLLRLIDRPGNDLFDTPLSCADDQPETARPLRIHSSVGTCQKCGQLIARDLLTRCPECEVVVFGPDCAVPSSDPDVPCCSPECAAAFTRRDQEETERQRREFNMVGFAARLCGMEQA